jgi:hypothetical protein
MSRSQLFSLVPFVYELDRDLIEIKMKMGNREE